MKILTFCFLQLIKFCRYLVNTLFEHRVQVAGAESVRVPIRSNEEKIEEKKLFLGFDFFLILIIVGNTNRLL